MAATRLVGIDLGGTSIRAAMATGAATHGDRVQRRTPHADGPEAVLAVCAQAAREAAGGTPDGVAIGIPGPLDPKGGVVYAAPHLQGWTNVGARDILEGQLGCPVAVHNDANLAGYAEWVAGAGREADPFLFVTVSTGIGGAIIHGGDLYGGASGSAAEIGHLAVAPGGPACGQGHPGCLEGLASGTAIAERLSDELAHGERSMVAAGADAGGVAVAARAGDELCLRLYREAGQALGRALGGVINLLSPAVIVIGGGMLNNIDLLEVPLHSGIGEIAFAVPAERCRVEHAALGTDAGLVGATAWAVRSFGPAH